MTRAESVHSTPPLNTPIDQGGLIQQRKQREKALKRIAKLRLKAFAEIERLIDFIDASDPYAATELEDQVDDWPCDTDELEVGWTGVTAGSANMPNESWIDEAEADGDGGDANDEPNLGSVEAVGIRGGQEYWASGNSDEGEADDGGRESDYEPSLCGVTAEARGDGLDREDDNDGGDESPDFDREPDHEDGLAFGEGMIDQSIADVGPGGRL